MLELGAEANRFPPELKSHDRYGNRVDEVEFHPSWHRLMEIGVENGLHSLPWTDPGPGANVARATLFSMLAQAEAGVGCPISMTYSVVPALRHQPELAEVWEPRFLSDGYDGHLLPADRKPGALAGMAMTEKQGGSDVRANTTRAEAMNGGGPGGEYAITGHKWFCSAPMCDAFLVLAQAEGGLSCFLLPRFTPDDQLNSGFRIQRLKDKLGNRSNASSEVEFDRAFAVMVGEEGRGIQTIIEMVSHTRLDCAIGSMAGIRKGTAEAIHHASHRQAFGKTLVDQPLMANVLADLAIESEAADLERALQVTDGLVPTISTSTVIATITHLLPEQVSLQGVRIEFEEAPRQFQILLKGCASSGDILGDFERKLASCPVFSGVTLSERRTVEWLGRRVDEFTVSLQVPLDVQLRAPATLRVASGGIQ